MEYQKNKAYPPTLSQKNPETIRFSGFDLHLKFDKTISRIQGFQKDHTVPLNTAN
ncbi:hypothetical protein CHRY9293_00210 [Chryseobacterium potabilaquae]|uniref:Uncharacterized protein n=1 Tax=Chryseobacterium potabilaquae TaxID=2675057 RepID=A0A6N4WZB5_9FLAO|nr:hypothetical protein CHRY9293_00210 [Chryseobacterium potabilaquae]